MQYFTQCRSYLTTLKLDVVSHSRGVYGRRLRSVRFRLDFVSSPGFVSQYSLASRSGAICKQLLHLILAVVNNVFVYSPFVLMKLRHCW